MQVLFNRLLFVSIILFLIAGCGEKKMEQKFTVFLEQHVAKVQPLMKEMNSTYWNASISGDEAIFNQYADLEFKLKTIYSDTNDFAFLKNLKKSGQINKPLLNRQLEILYRSYLGNQLAPDLLKQIVGKAALVEKKFSTFRGTLDGKQVTDNEIKLILREETNSSRREAAWLVSKQVGKEVATDIIELVKLRNEAAKKLGFDNYYQMSLTLADQKHDELINIFDELAELTTAPFINLKAELDGILARMYGIAIDDLMPWHYHDPFFQEGPLVYDVDLNKYYADQDIRILAQKFYKGIILDVDDILERSDLYEKDKKNPHAYCTSIDRAGDVRILTNLKNDEKWMDTILHELGHAVYDKYIDIDLPFLLREPAHTFTTEAVAMFFGRLSRNAYWIQQMVGISDSERDQIADTVSKSLRLQQLIFARWCQVMFRFEQELYRNPDQDLNKLWWDLVEKYQMIKRPADHNEPDWAAKIHFTIAPVYYHNYMLGELFASQLHFYIIKNILKLDSDIGISYVNESKVGEFMKNKIFKVGSALQWNEMIKQTTGEYLTPTYFVEQFIK